VGSGRKRQEPNTGCIGAKGGKRVAQWEKVVTRQNMYIILFQQYILLIPSCPAQGTTKTSSFDARAPQRRKQRHNDTESDQSRNNATAITPLLDPGAGTAPEYDAGAGGTVTLMELEQTIKRQLMGLGPKEHGGGR
jgi:hypothetical protein